MRLRQTDGRRQRALEIQQQHEIRLQKQQYQSAANASRDKTTRSSGADFDLRGTRSKLRTLERARLRNAHSLQLNTELEQQEDNQHSSHLDTGNIIFIMKHSHYNFCRVSGYKYKKKFEWVLIRIFIVMSLSFLEILLLKYIYCMHKT